MVDHLVESGDIKIWKAEEIIGQVRALDMEEVHAAVAAQHGAEPLQRPAALAGDTPDFGSLAGRHEPEVLELCGNKARARGLLDEYENEDTENVELIRKTNESIRLQVKELSK